MALLLYVIDEGVYFVSRKGSQQYIPFVESEKLDGVLTRVKPFTKVRLIFDLYEEDVGFVEVPKAYPWERDKITRLQLKKQGGANVLLAGADWIARRKEKKDQLRIRRLVAEEHVKLIFERLQKHQLVILQIYSSTFLLEKLLPKLNLERSFRKLLASRAVLTTVRRDASSYRQLFFQDGIVKFTRTLQLPELIEGDREVLTYLAREADMTIKYLYSNKRLISAQAPVSTLWIESPKFSLNAREIQEFMLDNLTEARNWPLGSFQVEAAKADRFCASSGRVEFLQDILLCQLKKKAFPPTHFQHPHLDAAAKVQTGRWAAMAATALVLSGGGWVVGQLGSEKWFLEEKIDFMTQKIRQTEQLKRTLQEKLNTEYDARDLKEIVKFSKQFQYHAERQSILKLLEKLAAFMAKNPDVRLSGLNFSRGGNPLNEGFWVDAQMYVDRPLVLYRQAIARIEKLKDDLAQATEISRVSLTHLPIHIDLKKQQQVDKQLVLPKRAAFSLRFFWRGGDAL